MKPAWIRGSDDAGMLASARSGQARGKRNGCGTGRGVGKERVGGRFGGEQNLAVVSG